MSVVISHLPFRDVLPLESNVQIALNATRRLGSSLVSGQTMILVKAILVVSLVVLLASEGSATVLYVRYNLNEIIIGTDSKRTAETGQTVCVCKILQVGDAVIASAGLAEYGPFDPRDFAREAITSTKTLVEARERFEDMISQPLIDVLTKVKNKSRTRYEVFKTGGAINMVFARFKERPELVTTALIPKDGPDGKITLEKNRFTLLGNVTRTKRIFVGVSKRAEAMMDRSGFWAKGTVEGVRHALQISIEDKNDAGGPIDLVQLTKGSVRWIPHLPKCDEKGRRVDEQPSTCNSSSP